MKEIGHLIETFENNTNKLHIDIKQKQMGHKNVTFHKSDIFCYFTMKIKESEDRNEGIWTGN